MRKKIVSLLTFIAIGFLILMSVKGVKGNPTPSEIYENLQDESMPFELSPERGRYALLTSVVDNKSIFFSEEIAKYVVPDLGYVNGHYVSLFAPGVSYMAIPLYVIGKSFNLGQVFAFLTSGVFAFLNVILIANIVKKLTKVIQIGIICGIIFLFASNSWAYGASLYQHHITTLLLLLSFRLLLSKISFLNALVVGMLLSFSFFVEYPNAIFFIPIMFSLALSFIDISELSKKITFKISYSVLGLLLGFVLLLIPSFVYNSKAYGSPFHLAGTVQDVKDIGEEGKAVALMNDNSRKSVGGFFLLDELPTSMSVLLTSKDRGILYFSPFVILALLGIKPLYKKNRKICITILGVIFSIFSLYGIWGDPWGGWAFGPRYLIPIVAFSCLLLGVAINKYGKRMLFKIPLFTVFIYSLVINAAGALTTLQIPPSVEVDYANYPEFPFLYNIDLVMKGKSSSYIYNNYFNQFIELRYYALMMVFIISMLFFAQYHLYAKNNKKLEKIL